MGGGIVHIKWYLSHFFVEQVTNVLLDKCKQKEGSLKTNEYSFRRLLSEWCNSHRVTLQTITSSNLLDIEGQNSSRLK